MLGAKSRINKRFQVLGNRREQPKQNHSTTFEGDRPLKGNLPEVLVESQYDPAIRFGALERAIFETWTICPRPKNVMILFTQTLDDWPREVFIRQNSHSGGDRVGLVLVREVACVGEARKDVLSGKARIVGQDLTLGLAGGQQLKDEFDGYTSPADYRLASQDLGIDDDAFRPRHESIIHLSASGNLRSSGACQSRHEDFSKLSEQQLIGVLHDSPIATPVSARAGAAIGELMRRLGERVLELNQAIDRLNESSTRLVSETNRLTTRILWLTIVGVVLAAVGGGIAVVQLIKK